MKTFIAILLALCGSAVHAQTSGPIYVECKTKNCSGSFEIRNDQLVPISFTIESYAGTQFTSLRSLGSSEHLELSQNSGRLSPKETHQIDFKFRCDESPCNITLLTGFMTGKHTVDGVAVRLILPFTIYSCQSGKNCRKSALEAAGLPTKK